LNYTPAERYTGLVRALQPCITAAPAKRRKAGEIFNVDRPALWMGGGR
jgi:hypothetical protein